MKTIFLKLIRLYQKHISLPGCRFNPTCSEYCFQAIEKYGILRGCFLGSKRILRCHPFSEGGNDPLN